ALSFLPSLLHAHCYSFYFTHTPATAIYTLSLHDALPIFQWQRLVPHLGKIPGQIGRTAYGVSWCPENSPAISYLCGVEVSDFSSLPLEFTIVSIPAQRYAVFSHRGHVSRIRVSIVALGSTWF